MARKLNRCILIVCEGTKTEHDYFRFIASNYSKPNRIWDEVEISDNKTIPNDIPISKPTELGTRKKRQFTNPNKRPKKDQNVLKELHLYLYGETEGLEKYDEVKAYPLRFVAQAELIEEAQGMYEELWAVFDKDGHTHHKEAYERAKLKIVHIGFTSRSFEHWLLLHFEKNKQMFDVSECKDINGDPIGCNSQIGCNGEICLAGYIRVNTPLNNYSKSNSEESLVSMMKILMSPEYLNNAFENAKWLRAEIENDPLLKDKKCYELNPYTDVDFLVKRLTE